MDSPVNEGDNVSDTTTQDASDDAQHFETYLHARKAAEVTARAALKTSQEVRRLSTHVQKCTSMYDRSVRTLLTAHEELEDASHVLVLQRARAKLAEANLRGIGGQEAIESLRATLFEGMFSPDQGECDDDEGEDDDDGGGDDQDDDDDGESQAPARRPAAPRTAVPRRRHAKDKDKDKKKKKKKAPRVAAVSRTVAARCRCAPFSTTSSRRARAESSGKMPDPGLEMQAHADKVMELAEREREAESME